MHPSCVSSLRSYILNLVTMRCCHEAGVWIIRFGGLSIWLAGVCLYMGYLLFLLLLSSSVALSCNALFFELCPSCVCFEASSHCYCSSPCVWRVGLNTQVAMHACNRPLVTSLLQTQSPVVHLQTRPTSSMLLHCNSCTVTASKSSLAPPPRTRAR